MKTFDEYNSLQATVRWRSGKTPVSPTTLHYKLINKSHRKVLVDWTAIPASADASVILDAQLIKVLGRARLELQEITFAADKGTSQQVTQTYGWYVENEQAT